MSREAELSESARRIQVVAGVLCDAADKVLISDRVRARSMQEYWEFPGGKVNPGESSRAALCRELNEELGIAVRSCEHLQTIRHDYPEQSVEIEFFVVDRWQGTPSGMEGQALRWVKKRDLAAASLLPADAPVVASLSGER